ncbi:MAG: hypothetical protein IKU19_00725, partial [Clostridia bacterium]|nr:hypothetical protein [Clostridia bacterium]
MNVSNPHFTNVGLKAYVLIDMFVCDELNMFIFDKLDMCFASICFALQNEKKRRKPCNILTP